MLNGGKSGVTIQTLTTRLIYNNNQKILILGNQEIHNVFIRNHH